MSEEREQIRAVAREVLTSGREASDVSGVWRTMVELGWPLVGVAEELGGSGGSLGDLMIIVEEAARGARSTPLIEVSAAAAGLAQVDGDPVAAVGDTAPGSLALAVQAEFDADFGTLTGGPLELQRLPWVRDAGRVLVVPALSLPQESGRGQDRWLDVVPGVPGAIVTQGRNLAGEPRDSLELAQVDPAVVGVGAVGAAQKVLRLGRLASLVGAAAGALEIMVAFTSERRQFGRPVAAFQLVSAHIANTYARLVQLRASVDDAIAATEANADDWPLRLAVAAVMASREAGPIAASAHQVHGAIGVTEEYPLHRFTTRLWSWREEFRRPLEPEATLASSGWLDSEERVWGLITA